MNNKLFAILLFAISLSTYGQTFHGTDEFGDDCQLIIISHEGDKIKVKFEGQEYSNKKIVTRLNDGRYQWEKSWQLGNDVTGLSRDYSLILFPGNSEDKPFDSFYYSSYGFAVKAREINCHLN